MSQYTKRDLFKFICLNKEFFEKMIIRDTCYVCGEKIKEKDFDIAHTYWGAFMVAKHKECSMNNHIKECQTIDGNCNDCKYFHRPDSSCFKLNKPTIASPNFCSNHECFEHRLS